MSDPLAFLASAILRDPLADALCISPSLQPAFELAIMDKAWDASYRILDLPFGAGEHEIRKAFKSKALQHHPDKGGSASAFQRAQDAMNVLLYDLNGPSKPCCSKEERQEVRKARAATRAAQRKGFETALAAGNKRGTHKLRSKEKLRSERIAQQTFLVQRAEKAKQAKEANKQCKRSKPKSSQDHREVSAPPSKSDKSPTDFSCQSTC